MFIVVLSPFFVRYKRKYILSTFHLQNIGGDIMQQSILGQILPEAMVCYLENYGAEKFAEIFLGEFDTPEVINSFSFKILCINFFF